MEYYIRPQGKFSLNLNGTHLQISVLVLVLLTAIRVLPVFVHFPFISASICELNVSIDAVLFCVQLWLYFE